MAVYPTITYDVATGTDTGDMGPELVTNGSFATDTDWTKSASATISGGECRIQSPDGSYQYIAKTDSAYTATQGKVVEVSIDITDVTAGYLYVRFSGGSAKSIPASVGTHTLTFINDGTTGTINIARAGGVTDVSFTNVSVREVVGAGPELVNNGTFGYGITGWTDNSEDTGSIEWNSSGALQLNNPDGSTNAEGRCWQSVTVEIGKPYRFQVQRGSGAPSTIQAGYYVGGVHLFGSGLPIGTYPVDVVIVPTQSPVFISLRNWNQTTPVLIDNVSVTEVGGTTNGFGFNGDITDGSMGPDAVTDGGFNTGYGFETIENGDFATTLGTDAVTDGGFESGYGFEAVTNGSFATDTDWTKSASATISGGECRIQSPDGSYQYIRQVDASYTATQGKMVEVSIDITDVTAGQLKFQFVGGSEPAIPASVGTHTFTVINDGTSGDFRVARASGATDVSFTNVSVREVVGAGSELVTNGTFDSDITGWTDDSEPSGSSQWDGVGQMELLNPNGSTSEEGVSYQLVTVVIGTRYRVQITRSGGASYCTLGVARRTVEYLSSSFDTADIDIVIVPTTTTLAITLRNFNSTTPALIDNVSVTEVLPAEWEQTDGVSMVGGVCRILGDGVVLEVAKQTGYSALNGTVCEVTLDVIAHTTGAPKFSFGGDVVYTFPSTIGTHTMVIRNNGTNNWFYLYGLGVTDFTIDNLTVKEVIETDWTVQVTDSADSIIIHDGSCRFNSTAGAYQAIYQDGTYTSGNMVEVTVEITEYTSGTLRCIFDWAGGNYHSFPQSVGTHTHRFVNNTTSGRFRLVNSGATDITIGSVTVKERFGTGPELINNGTFGYGIAGWKDASDSPGSIEWDSSGKLKLNNPNGLVSQSGIAYQEIPVEIGKSYQIKAFRSGGNSYFQAGTGKPSEGAAAYDYFLSINRVGIEGEVIVATTTSLFIKVQNYNDTTPSLIEYVSVKEVLDTEWTQSTGTSMGGGACRINTTGDWAYAQQTNAAYTATQGKVVEVTLDITAIGATNAGQIKASFAGGANQVIFPASIGTHSVTLINDGTTGNFSLGRVSGGLITDITFDNVSVREVTTSGSELVINGDFGASTVLGPDLVTDGDFNTGRGFDTVTNGEMANTLGSDAVTDGTFDAGYGFEAVTNGSFATTLGTDTILDGTFDKGYGLETVVNGTFDTTLGSELTANGSFTASTHWTGTGSNGWSIDTASQQLDAVSATSYVYQGLSLVSNKVYEVVVDATLTSGACVVNGFNATTIIDINISGRNTYTALFSETDTNPNFGFVAGAGGFTGSIHSVSVKEVIETDWDHTSGAVIYDGSCNLTSDGSFEYILQSGHTATQGKVIEISINITDVTSGSIDVGINGDGLTAFSTVGTHTFKMINNGTVGQLLIRRTFGAPCDITFDNVSVREIFGEGDTLVTNGDFAEGITGWTDNSEGSGSSQWNSSGALQLNNPSGLATTEGISEQEITVVIGKEYRFKAERSGGNSLVRIGSAQYLNDYYQSPVSIVDVDLVIVATTTSLWISLRNFNSTTPALIDNVSVKEVLAGDWTQTGPAGMVSGGACRFYTPGFETAQIFQSTAPIAALIGKPVEVSIDITEYISGNIRCIFDGGAYRDLPQSAGTHKLEFLCDGTSTTGSQRFRIVTSSAETDITFDNLTVREVVETDWFKYNGATVYGGALRLVNTSGPGPYVQQNASSYGDLNGKVVEATIVISSQSGTGVQFRLGDSPYRTAITGTGTFTFTYVSDTANGKANIYSPGPCDNTVDSFSVREVVGAGPELVTNGTFVSSISGWLNTTMGTGSASWDSSGKAKLSNPDGTWPNVARLHQEVTVVAGKTYRVQATKSGVGAGVGCRFSLGDTQWNNSYLYTSTYGVAVDTTVTVTSTSLWIMLLNAENTGDATFDDVSVTEVLDAEWIQTGGMGMVSGACRVLTDAAGTLEYIRQDGITATQGKVVEVSLDITEYVSGNLKVVFEGQVEEYTIPGSVGTHTLAAVNNGTNGWLMIKRASGGILTDITFDNVTVKEVIETDWGQNGNAIIYNNEVSLVAPVAAGTYITQGGATSTIGKLCEITLEITEHTTGAIRFYFLQGNAYTFPETVGTHKIIAYNNGNTMVFTRNAGATDLKFTNVSVREVVGYGPELVTNGTFVSPITGWASNNGNSTLTRVGDTAEFANQVDWSYMRYPMTIDSSKTYRVSFDVSAISGPLHIGLGSTGNTISASGSYTYAYSSSATTYDFQIRPTTAGLKSCTIDNISITEVLDPEWDQSGNTSMVSGACRMLTTGPNAYIRQTDALFTPSEGKLVEVSINITNYVSGYLRVRFTGDPTYHDIPASAGTHTVTFVNQGTSHRLEVVRSGATDITFDNLTVRRVLAPTGWTDASESPASIQTDSTGHLELTNPNGLITEEAMAYQEVPVVIGIPYQVKADKSGGPSIMQIGTASATGDYYQSPNTVADINEIVVATTSSLFVTARNYNWSAAPALVDNITVTEVRSAPTLTFNETVNCTGAENDGGSDYVWIDTPASDRKLFTVTSFLPTVSACTSVRTLESPTADVTGDSWAINGTRKTLDSGGMTASDPEYWGPGWTIQFASGTYSTEAFRPGYGRTWAPADDALTIKALPGASSRPIISLTSNHHNYGYLMRLVTGTKAKVRGLHFKAGTGAGIYAYILAGDNNTELWLDDCVVVPHPTAPTAVRAGIAMHNLTNCYFVAGADSGVDFISRYTSSHMSNCIIDGLSGTLASNAGVYVYGGNVGKSIRSCVVKGVAGDGIQLYQTYPTAPTTHAGGIMEITNCTVVDNAGHGITAVGGAAVPPTVLVTTTLRNNIIAYNGGYGVTDTVPSSIMSWLCDNNAVYGNGNGSYNGKPVPGPRDITLTVDPFTNHDAGDYTLNNVTDGGSKLRSKSYPTPSDQDWPSTPEDG